VARAISAEKPATTDSHERPPRSWHDEYWRLIRVWPFLVRWVSLKPGTAPTRLAVNGRDLVDLVPGAHFSVCDRIREINRREAKIRNAMARNDDEEVDRLNAQTPEVDVLLMVSDDDAFDVAYFAARRYRRATRCGLYWRLTPSNPDSFVFNQGPYRWDPPSVIEREACVRARIGRSVLYALHLRAAGLPDELVWIILTLAAWR
jgi:hypothetical protein